MSEIMEEYAKEYAREKVAEARAETRSEDDANAEAFMRKLGISEAQILEFRRQTAEKRSKS